MSVFANEDLCHWDARVNSWSIREDGLCSNSFILTEVCHIAHFWESYHRCAMHGLPMVPHIKSHLPKQENRLE